ncbi:MAG: FprA family A-type flavoprotein [Candidatus Marinimicrobia bacterium]|nr:FprA family A-type flavoprotein [Candidatus Neomarinimicrobiota bacterium]
MNRNIKLTEDIYYVGVNDRRTHLFENLWPLPEGIAYNAYLIRDKKNVLIDTVEISKTDDLIREVKAILDGRDLDYLVVNHTEPDHSGAINALVKTWPDLCIVGNKVTFRFLEGFYGDWKNKKIIENGDLLDTGKHKLRFYSTPMIHWPETMMTFDENDGVLFSGDAFGSFKTLDGAIFDDALDLNDFENEMRRYFSNIVGKYGKNVQRALTSLKDLPVKMIASAHGPVFRTDLNWVLSRYDRWSREDTKAGVVVVYGSMYGHTEAMAEHTARKLKEAGVPEVRIYDASKTHASYILSAVWEYTGVVLASPAYNNDLFPSVKNVVEKFLERKMKNRYVGVIGTASWSGGGVKTLNKLVETLGWEAVGESVEAKYSAGKNDLENCTALAQKLSRKVLNESEA